jgi:hypothetical protein
MAQNDRESYERVHEKHLCRHCGFSKQEHRASDLHCPATGTFPKWPSTIRDEARAGKVFDQRLARHWAARKTKFKPV